MISNIQILYFYLYNINKNSTDLLKIALYSTIFDHVIEWKFLNYKM